MYFPGEYPVISRNEKISDIIRRAGGFLPNAYPMASTFIRNNKMISLSFEKIIRDNKSNANFAIMGGDSIIISTYSNIIEIVGEVNQPGFYKFYNGYSLKRYIDIAGGLNINAEKKEIWVTYPDGTSKQLKPFIPSPKIYDGSTITIGLKEDSEPFDLTEFSKDFTQILANLAQVIIFYSAIKN